MEETKSSLVVSLHNVEFAKEYHYFITVQLESDGQKVQLHSAQVWPLRCLSHQAFLAHPARDIPQPGPALPATGMIPLDL